ncbi:MAG: hypothetical protein H8E61_09180 [Bacteroidetes bacterium]|nr:hypothetical protein [Bacteroidota bacterium]
MIEINENDFLTGVRRKIKKKKQQRSFSLLFATVIITVIISVQTTHMIQNHQLKTLYSELRVEPGLNEYFYDLDITAEQAANYLYDELEFNDLLDWVSDDYKNFENDSKTLTDSVEG